MKITGIKQLDSVLAKREKGKKQMSIAQIKEVRSIMCDLIYTNPEVVSVMRANARKRYARKNKK